MAKPRGRPLWSGSISFGLVNVPIRLFTATSPHTVHFHELQRGTGQRIHHKRVAERSGREVAYTDIVKGFELSKDRYVAIEPKELEAVEPRQTRTLDIEAFVDLQEIDPIYWDQTYYVGPGEGAGAEKSYELLRRTMVDTGKVGVGRFVMRTKQYLATVRPFGRGLALDTMFYADEIRDPAELGAEPPKVSVSEKELGLAKQLVGALSGPWEPKKYEDTYERRVRELIEQKARGETIASPEAPAETGEVVDLMAALKASLESGGRRAPHGGGNGSKRKSPRAGKASKPTRAARGKHRHAPAA
jgi:DNA end-binding protein Ku